MSDTHNAMTSSRERGAWSTSGYLIFVLFLLLLALTIWRIIAFAGGDPADDAVFGFVVRSALSVVALMVIASGFYGGMVRAKRPRISCAACAGTINHAAAPSRRIHASLMIIPFGVRKAPQIKPSAGILATSLVTSPCRQLMAPAPSSRNTAWATVMA